VKDDYDGYLPSRADFISGTFEEKYHDNEFAESKEKILTPEELSDYFKGKRYSHRKELESRISSGFTSRIVLPTILAIVLFVTSIYVIVIPLFRRSIMDRKKEMIKELTHTAVSAINYYIEQEKNGVMSMESAQTAAAGEIKKMRYGEDQKDYFWVTDMHPNMVVHPYRPELIGQDLSGYRDREDKSGKLLFVEFVHLVKDKGHGYLTYLWQWKDDEKRTAPKLSYVEGVPEWGWIVGTGMYIHDVEHEINRLSHSLFIDFAIITLFLIVAMVYVIFQSRRIEKDRQQAEIGLREAKERYRALAETSNEGYLLEVGGSFIYANRALQRMLGYDESDLTRQGLWDRLLPKLQSNEKVRRHLEALKDNPIGTGEYEAQVRTGSGVLIDVIIATSRIFFAHKIGHIVVLRPVSRSMGEGMEDLYRDALPLSAPTWSPDYLTEETLGPLVPLVEEIEQSRSAGHVIHALNHQPKVLRQWISQGVRPAVLRQAIGRLYHASLKRFVEISIEELGEPPTHFAFVSLGSNARFEMTLFSDQDNALVYSDVEGLDEKRRVQKYFLTLGDAVCTRLAQAGYPFCPGGIMASNPQYCLPLSEWRNNFNKWFSKALPESILEVNVFFDLYCAYGEKILVDELSRTVNYLGDAYPSFFGHFARNALLYKPPLGVLKQLKSDRKEGHPTIDIKECIKPLEIFARVYALQNKINTPSTSGRLLELFKREKLQDETYYNISYVFDALWHLRFYNQIVAHADLKSVVDELSLNSLTDVERLNVRNLLKQIPVFQSKLSFDFLGSAL
jgi:PAS domain S-box-containing protein